METAALLSIAGTAFLVFVFLIADTIHKQWAWRKADRDARRYMESRPPISKTLRKVDE